MSNLLHYYNVIDNMKPLKRLFYYSILKKVITCIKTQNNKKTIVKPNKYYENTKVFVFKIHLELKNII